MEVRIRYLDNRLDVFDTDAFTTPEPFGDANMLTDFELRFDRLGEAGLWLVAHSYDASPAYRDQTAEGETPVARRKRGWRFLLAETGEVDRIESVAVGSEVALQRMSGELVDMLRLDEAAAVWLPGADGMCAAEKAVGLFEVLTRATGGEKTPEEVARMCGCTLPLVTELQAVVGTENNEEEEQEEQWMEGLDDEVSG